MAIKERAICRLFIDLRSSIKHDIVRLGSRTEGRAGVYASALFRAWLASLYNTTTKAEVILSMGKIKRTYGKGKITEATKLELVARYGDTCNFCGERNLAKNRRLTFDHIDPFSEGGSDDIENIQILCRSCNSIKRNKSQKEFEDFMRKKNELPKMISELSSLFPEIIDDAKAFERTFPVERAYNFIKPLYDSIIQSKAGDKANEE